MYSLFALYEILISLIPSSSPEHNQPFFLEFARNLKDNSTGINGIYMRHVEGRTCIIEEPNNSSYLWNSRQKILK